MVHLSKEKRQKWEAKSEGAMFMGYSENSNAYRVYNFKTQDVAVSCDGIFLDEKRVARNEASPTMEEAPFEMIMQNEVVEEELIDVEGIDRPALHEP